MVQAGRQQRIGTSKSGLNVVCLKHKSKLRLHLLQNLLFGISTSVLNVKNVALQQLLHWIWITTTVHMCHLCLHMCIFVMSIRSVGVHLLQTEYGSVADFVLIMFELWTHVWTHGWYDVVFASRRNSSHPCVRQMSVQIGNLGFDNMHACVWHAMFENNTWNLNELAYAKKSNKAPVTEVFRFIWGKYDWKPL